MVLGVDQLELLPTAAHHFEVKATQSGYINEIQAEQIGIAAMVLGAGRAKKEDLIDYAVGLTLNKKIGDEVQVGDAICTIHANRLDVSEVEAMILDAYKIAANKPAPVQLIYDVIV